MTGRERLLNVLHRKPVDRTPVTPFIHMNYVKAFFEDHEADVVARTLDVYAHFGFDVIHRNAFPAYDAIGASCTGWEVSSDTETDGRDQTITTTVHTPKGDLKQVFRILWVVEYDAEATPVEYLIKSEADFETLVEYQPPETTIDMSAVLRAKELTDDQGLIAPWIQGAFNHVAYYYRPLDQLLMDAMTNPAFYHRVMEHFLRRNMAVAAQYIEAGVDLLSYGANIASGKMISSDFYREFVFPYEKRLVDFIQARGVGVLHHNCGYATKLFAHYRDVGMAIHESLTAPPFGDTILEEAFEALSPDIVLHGGIDQIDFLMKASPAEVEARTQETLERAHDRGPFILGTSDYLHEQTPKPNLEALARAAGCLG